MGSVTERTKRKNWPIISGVVILLLAVLLLVSFSIFSSRTYTVLSQYQHDFLDMSQGEDIEVGTSMLRYIKNTQRIFFMVSGVFVIFILIGLYVLIYWNRLLHNQIKERTKEFLTQTKKLKKSEKDLASTIDQLEKINSIMVGRELKMIDMKKELKNLKKK
ncbi:hypothetical protein C0581_02515 [Candidatus Parcubacteria bacterium]|nr:MAG: hypothetical protein C0581_02515 [Candidatus Parcubacteria bacterium]